jgi:hypothetical protein
VTHIFGITGYDSGGAYTIISSDSQSSSLDNISKNNKNKVVTKNQGRILLAGTGCYLEKNISMPLFANSMTDFINKLDRESDDNFGFIISSFNRNDELVLKYVHSKNHIHLNRKLSGSILTREIFSHELEREMSSSFYVREFKKSPIILSGSGSYFTIPTLRENYEQFSEDAQKDFPLALALSYELFDIASNQMCCDNRFNLGIHMPITKPLLIPNPQNISSMQNDDKIINFLEHFMDNKQISILLKNDSALNSTYHQNIFFGEIYSVYQDFYNILCSHLEQLSKDYQFLSNISSEHLHIIGIDSIDDDKDNLETRIQWTKYQILKSFEAFTSHSLGDLIEFVETQQKEFCRRRRDTLDFLLS